MASRLMSNFSGKNESSIDIEQGSIGEYSNGSAVHSPDIKVDESQDAIYQAPETTHHTPIVPEHNIPLEKTPWAKSQDAKPKEHGAGIERKRDANVLFGSLLAMTPAKEFVFPPNDGLRDSHEVLSLYNASKTQPVAFKIQTTSPDGYRVVPPMGIIDTHRQADVVITLLPGHRHAAHDDKFMLTAMTLSERRVKLSLRSKSIWTLPLSNGEVRTENRFSCRVIDEEDCTSDDAGDTNIFKGFHEKTPLMFGHTPDKVKHEPPLNMEGVEQRMRMLFSFIIGTLLIFILFLLCLVVSFSFGAVLPQDIASANPHGVAPEVTRTHNTARTTDALGLFPD